MNKKRALICSILLYSVGLIYLVVYLVGSIILDVFPTRYRTLLPISFIMFFIGGLIMTVVYFRLKNAELAAQKAAPAATKLDDKQLAEWLQKFEPFVRMGAKLTSTNAKTFTKFGGLPIVPTNFVWPTFNNRPLPFLLQIDFAEINRDGKLSGFPVDGLLYVFADSDEINDPKFEAGEPEFAQGRSYQFLFFDKTDELIIAQKPAALVVYDEFHVAADIVKTYPDTDDCAEAFDLYCDRPLGGMDDAYDDLQNENMDAFMIGGWPTYIQGSRFDGVCAPEKTGDWVPLMQIASHPDDEKFMWGDDGTLYFYIRKQNLSARNFGNVKMDMQCY